MSELDIAERRVPQDGRFRVRYKGRLIDFRVSIMPTIHGEDAVLRVLDKESMSEKFAKLSLDVVGFAEADLVKFRRYIKEPYGMVLVTGPTGSGKTTTLYAALSEIKNDEDKIITIEDPGRISDQGHHADSGEREEGADLRARPALHSAPRSGQDHGGRNPRPGNRADRHQLRAHRPPGVHHRPRQQRARRAGPLPEHGRGAVQLRLRAELHPGAAAGARDLRALQDAGALSRCACLMESGLESGGVARRSACMKARAASNAAAPASAAARAIHELLDLSDQIREMILDRRPTSEIKRAAREEGMTFLRESAVDKVRDGHHHAERNQQGDVHRRLTHRDPLNARYLMPVPFASSPVFFRIRRRSWSSKSRRTPSAWRAARDPKTIQAEPLRARRDLAFSAA